MKNESALKGLIPAIGLLALFATSADELMAALLLKNVRGQEAAATSSSNGGES